MIFLIIIRTYYNYIYWTSKMYDEMLKDGTNSFIDYKNIRFTIIWLQKFNWIMIINLICFRTK